MRSLRCACAVSVQSPYSKGAYMRTFIAAIAASVLVLTGISAANAALSPYKVSISLNHTSSNAGSSIVVSGTVTGSKANGSSVRIQRKYVGGSWTTVATDTISSSKYSARVETPRGGSTSFRVLKGASSTHSSAISATKTIKVYEWLYLANETPIVLNGNVVAPIELLMSTTTYGRSIRINGGEDATLLWKLNGACTTMAMAAEHNNEQPAATDVDVIVSRAQMDSTSPPNATTTLHPNVGPSTITSSLSSTKFLQIGTDGLFNGNVGFGNPRVRCNADHLYSLTNGDF